MSMKVEKCCLCIDVQMGVYILGCFTVLGILNEIEHFQFARTISCAGTIIAFLVMLFNNSAQTRCIWFIAYIGNWVVQTLAFLFIATPEQGGIAVTDWGQQACDDMNEDDLADFETQHGDCLPAMKQYILYVMIICMTLGTIVSVHFFLVNHTYWQEAVEAEGKGTSGSPDDAEEPLMD